MYEVKMYDILNELSKDLTPMKLVELNEIVYEINFIYERVHL